MPKWPNSFSVPGEGIISSLYYLAGTGLYVGTAMGTGGERGSFYLYSGEKWTELAHVGRDISKDINALWASAGDNVYLGTLGGVYRYNGYELAGPMYPYCDNANRIWGTAADNIYLVGDSGTIMRYGP